MIPHKRYLHGYSDPAVHSLQHALWSSVCGNTTLLKIAYVYETDFLFNDKRYILSYSSFKK